MQQRETGIGGISGDIERKCIVLDHSLALWNGMSIFLVVGFVVSFSIFMMLVEPVVTNGFGDNKAYWSKGKGDEDEYVDTPKVLFDFIEGMTRIEPMLDNTPEECGLASMGVSVLVGVLNNTFSKITGWR